MSNGDDALTWRLAGMDTKFCMAEYGDGLLRPYRVFVPSSYWSAAERPSNGAPMVVMLHGGGTPNHPCDENWYFQNKETHDRVQTIAEQRGYIVACPALAFSLVPPDAPDRIDRITDEIVSRDVPLIEAVVNAVTYDYQVDRSRIYLSGASRGGIAAYAAVRTDPSRYAAFSAVSTRCPPEWRDEIARTPLVILHAVDDTIFSVDVTRRWSHDLAAAGCDVAMHEFPGVHDGLRFMDAYHVIFDWFDVHRRSKGHHRGESVTP